jgi:hypothetical protein
LQRALAHPEPLVRQLLNGGSERCQPEIIGIDQDMADFAVSRDSFV